MLGTFSPLLLVGQETGVQVDIYPTPGKGVVVVCFVVIVVAVAVIVVEAATTVAMIVVEVVTMVGVVVYCPVNSCIDLKTFLINSSLFCSVYFDASIGSPT